jgi:hypothetical protein
LSMARGEISGPRGEVGGKDGVNWESSLFQQWR